MGSSPFVGSVPRLKKFYPGSVSRAAKGADCKSAGDSLRRFESYLAHLLKQYYAFNILPAHVAQSAEHILGKNEVMGSSPIVGFMPRLPFWG